VASFVLTQKCEGVYNDSGVAVTPLGPLTSHNLSLDYYHLCHRACWIRDLLRTCIPTLCTTDYISTATY